MLSKLQGAGSRSTRPAAAVAAKARAASAVCPKP